MSFVECQFGEPELPPFFVSSIHVVLVQVVEKVFPLLAVIVLLAILLLIHLLTVRLYVRPSVVVYVCAVEMHMGVLYSVCWHV